MFTLLFLSLFSLCVVLAQDTTASCYSIVNGLLSGNSLLRPDVFVLQTGVILNGLNSRGISAADITQACNQGGDETTEFCATASTDPSFIPNINSATRAAVRGLQDCLTVFTAGGPDYQVNYATYYTETPVTPPDPNAPTPSQTRKRNNGFAGLKAKKEKRWSVIRERAPIHPAMPDERKDPYEHGPLKATFSNRTRLLSSRQRDTCANTGNCFGTCPACARVQQLCEDGGLTGIGVGLGCELLAGYTSGVAGGLSRGVCFALSLFCRGAAPRCLLGCTGIITFVVDQLASNLCQADYSVACDQQKAQCSACSAANGNVCDSGATQCCAGETGTACGVDCCCCPQCQAPGGPNCACQAAPC